jgi:hypothetical protein
MSLKMMKKTWLVSAFAAVSALSVVACGDSEDKDDADTEEPGGDGGSMGGGDGGTDVPATRTRSGTLVAITATDTSAPIPDPHKIVVLEALTGNPLSPALETMTAAGNGKWEIKDIPTDKPISFWVQGVGDATTGTYDSVITNVTGTTADDGLTRISNAGTAATAGIVSGFTPKQDRGAISMGVYRIRNGARVGVVGCVKVLLDESEEKTKEADLRYVASNGLPTTLAMQDKTESMRGAFLIANIPKGEHTIKFTVDDGKTYFGETKFYIGMARDDAKSAFKGILYQLGVEVPADPNLTPSGCI